MPNWSAVKPPSPDHTDAMKQRHPFQILLILLLGLCVFAAGFAKHGVWPSSAPVSELDEGFEEAMEELSEEDLLTGTDLIDFESCTYDIVSLQQAALPLTGACKRSPAHCSFGWVLPLRI